MHKENIWNKQYSRIFKLFVNASNSKWDESLKRIKFKGSHFKEQRSSSKYWEKEKYS